MSRRWWTPEIVILCDMSCPFSALQAKNKRYSQNSQGLRETKYRYHHYASTLQPCYNPQARKTQLPLLLYQLSCSRLYCHSERSEESANLLRNDPVRGFFAALRMTGQGVS